MREVLHGLVHADGRAPHSLTVWVVAEPADHLRDEIGKLDIGEVDVRAPAARASLSGIPGCRCALIHQPRPILLQRLHVLLPLRQLMSLLVLAGARYSPAYSTELRGVSHSTSRSGAMTL